MKTSKWIITVALVLALSISALPVSAAPGAAISLTAPTPNPVPVGSEVTFSLVIAADSVSPGVAGAEIYLAYDPLLVSPPASPLGVVEALPDFFGVSNISINEILPAGQCPGTANPCVHLVVAGPAQITHSGAAARFHFQGLAVGTATFTVLSPTLANADGFSVTPTITNPTVSLQIVSRTAQGIAVRQGTPANPNLGGGSLACTDVRSISSGITFGPAFTDVTGTFQLTNLISGIHKIQATYPGYLSAEKTLTISAGSLSTNLGSVTLIGGDINNDAKINILDIGRIISLFGKTGVEVKSDAGGCYDGDEPADINDDGNINISDLAITAGNWGRTGPLVWP